jgi:tetratricopeptide (TPR) repeat protein
MARKWTVALVVMGGLFLVAAAAQAAEEMSPPGTPKRILNPPQRMPFMQPRPSMPSHPPDQDHDNDRDHRRHSFVFFPYYYPYYYPPSTYYDTYPYDQTYYYYSPYLYYNYYAYPPGYTPGTPYAAPQTPGAAGQQPAAGQPAYGPAPGPGDERAFESPLSAMLGGPDKVGAAFALGETKLRMGEYADAVAGFQRAHEVSPEDPFAEIGLALALEATERYEGAAYMLRRGLASVTDWAAVDLNLADALGGKEKYDAMAARVQQAAAQAPDDLNLQLLLGFNAFGARQYAKAANMLLAVSKAVPADEGVKALLTAAERRLGSEPGKEGPGVKAGEGVAPGGAPQKEAAPAAPKTP